MGSEWGPLVLADDLAHRPVLSVTPDDNLHTALRRMTELNIDEIPVVDPEDSTRLLGLLSRRDLTLAYTSLIESLRSNRTTAAKPSPSGETVSHSILKPVQAVVNVMRAIDREICSRTDDPL